MPSRHSGDGAIPAAYRSMRSPSVDRPRAGIGLRAEHYRDVLDQPPDIGWMEVHSENYFGAGGRPQHYLDLIRRDYPISLHGVGLSLGSTDALDTVHLQHLRDLIARCEPIFVSEHLSWGSVGGLHLNDLLPLPYRADALVHMITRVAQVQEALGRQILIENLSSYLQFDSSDIPEWEFLAELGRRSGCGILLDVNNIYVSARNHGFDAHAYLRAIPVELVHEMHLAGHTVKTFDDGELLIDTHNQPVANDVWGLYQTALQRFGAVPTLVEWDTDLPPLDVLVSEANRAQRMMNEERHASAA